MAGSSSSAYPGNEIHRAWDGISGQFSSSCYFSNLTTGPHSISLYLGATVAVNAVTMLPSKGKC